MKKFNLKVFFTVLICLLSFIGCGEKKEKEKGKTTVILAQDNDITGLIPFEHANMPSGRLEDVLYSRLFDYDKDMNIVPVLAESYEMVNDNLTLRIKIREGVKFHNGEELTAEDIAFGFKFWRDSKVKAHMIDAVDEALVVDKYTVDVNLKYPYSPLLGNIVAGFSAVNKKAILENPNYKNEPVGTGPYKFVEWLPADKVVVEAFDDYFLGRSDIDRLVYTPVVEVSNRTLGLEAGDFQISYEIDPIDKDLIQNKKDLVYEEVPGTRINYVILNTQKESLKDSRVRRAISLAIDREGIITAVLMGNGKIADSLVPPQVFGHSNSVKPINQDLDSARKLLDEVGIAEGTKMTLLTADRGANLNTAQIIQANLKDIGIELQVNIVEWGTYLEQSAAGKHEIALGGWSTGTGDGDYSLYPLLHSSALGSQGNRSFYSNKEVDRLLAEARTNMDRDIRLANYIKIQDIVREEMPVIPLSYGVTNIARNVSISNIKMSADGRHNMHKLIAD